MKLTRSRATRLLPLSCLLLATTAAAQQLPSCPDLPLNSGLSWQPLAGPGYVFCKAVRDSDGRQAFGVTIGKDSPFEPQRGDRAESATIDGRQVYWYRSEVASDPNAQVRETLIELGPGRVAHIWLRADSAEELADTLRQAGSLHFEVPRLSER